MKICTSCGSPVSPASELCSNCGTRMTDHQGALTGATLAGKYLIEELLGSGGMCDVYRARHLAIDKEVAVKILKPELAADPKVAQRFEQEARAASRVRHPHAINVTDYGIGENNTPYLVMELIVGQTLREMLRENGAMPLERVVGIVHQACGALEVAHSVGVIHRDIKPDNIIISKYDGRDWVEVVDFGVAKIQEDVNRRSALTGANFIIGTPRYMSPEQCEEKPVDARSDIYSLGVVVYEMLTGDAPFEAASSTRLFMAHIAEPPPPVRIRRPDLKPEVEAVVMRALEKNPDRRPQSAMEFARELARAAGVIDPAQSDAGRAGAFSRISVPLDERPLVVEAMADIPEDEETLVKPRATHRPGDTDTLEDLKEHDPYITMSDADSLEEHDRRPSIESYSSVDSNADTLPDYTDEPRIASRRNVRGQSVERAGRKRISNTRLIIGLFALSVVVGFLAFLIFGNRSMPSTEPPSTNQPSRNPGNVATNSNAGAATPAGQSNSNQASAGAKPQASGANEEFNPPGEPTVESTPVDAGAARDEVASVISDWTASLQAKNLNAHMRYYAPTLHTYFLQSNVNRSVARSEVANALSRYSRLSINISAVEVRVEPSGKRAIATFEKSWSFEGDKPWSGATVERVWLRKAGNRWVITGVRDLR